MKKLTRIFAVMFYLIALGCIGVYMYFNFDPAVTDSPFSRLAMLGSACLTLYLGSVLLIKTVQKNRAAAIMKITFALCFVLYLCLITTLVLFDSYFGRSGYRKIAEWNAMTLSDHLKNAFNIIPFASIISYVKGLFGNSAYSDSDITNLFGNIIAFTPFAFFLPLFFKKMKSLKWFVLIMVCIVITVELLQFVLFTGFCDIDDVIMNVGGAVAAYEIFHIKGINRLINKLTVLQY